MAATFDDVPPTSTMTASPMAPVRSAPATEAAGPEYSASAGRPEPPDGGPRPRGVEAAGGVEELVNGAQRPAVGQVDAGQGGALAGLADVGGGGHAEDPHRHDVALEQGVDRLRGRVGDELDGIRAQAGPGQFGGDEPHHLHDAGGHAVGMGAGGG